MYTLYKQSDLPTLLPAPGNCRFGDMRTGLKHWQPGILFGSK